jgi:hypothetical protein
LWESQVWEFQDSHLGVTRQKATWMWPPWRGATYTIWGKVVASTKFGPWWVLWVRDCSWLVLAPKVLQQSTNQLVGWFCAGSCEWIICLSLFLVPSRSSSTPLYPSKCWELKSMPQALNLFVVFHFRLILEFIKELGSASMGVQTRNPLMWHIYSICTCARLLGGQMRWPMCLNGVQHPQEHVCTKKCKKPHNLAPPRAYLTCIIWGYCLH